MAALALRAPGGVYKRWASLSQMLLAGRPPVVGAACDRDARAIRIILDLHLCFLVSACPADKN